MLKRYRTTENRTIKGWTGIILLAASVGLSGCSKPVATVDGIKIDKSVFDLHLREKADTAAKKNEGQDMRKLGEAVLQELIVETLIISEANKMGITVTEEELDREISSIRRGMDEASFRSSLKEKGITPETFRSRTRDKMIMSKFIAGLADKAAISEEEMIAYYKGSNIPFIKPGRVLVKMIEVSSAEDAGRLADEIRNKKADFDETARRLEEEKKAVVIGYGWVTPDTLSPALAQALKNLGVAQQGGPYKGSKYYYLVRVKDREPESIAKYEEVRENIKKALLDQRRQQALSQWVRKKRGSAKIEIHMM